MISLFWNSGVGHLLHTGRRRTFWIRYLQLRQLWIWMAMFEMWKLSCLRRVNSHKASWWVCWDSLLALLGGPCAWWLAPVAARFVPSKKMETCWNSDETWTCLIYLRDLFLSLLWENTAAKTQKRSGSIVGFVGSSAWMHSCRLQADMNQLNLFPTFRMILSVLTLLCRTCRGTCVNIAGFQTIEDENLFIFIFFTIFCVTSPNKRIKSVDFKQLKSNLFNGCSRC